MLRSLDDLLGLIGHLYPEDAPKPFLLLQGVKRIKAGKDAGQEARSVHSTKKRLEGLAAAADPIEELFGCNLASAAEPDTMRRPQGMIGQLLLGELAERAFERFYKETMGTKERPSASHGPLEPSVSTGGRPELSPACPLRMSLTDGVSNFLN